MGLLAITLLTLGGFSNYAFTRIDSLENRVNQLTGGLASTSAELADRTENLLQGISSLEETTTGLTKTLTSTKQKVESTKSTLDSVQTKVGSVTKTVDTLERLSKIDGELLKKYSKVYFLNENYVPEHLISIEPSYLYSEKRIEQIRQEVWPHLKTLLQDARAQGITLYIKSSYRSFDEQQSIKSSYSVLYGAGTANQFSADQGYSEHQLGSTVDLITPGLGGLLTPDFAKTAPYQWLLNNAHMYGFIPSYPENNAYYIFEPWHWRYVGVQLATYLHDNNKRFYDMDQRTIDEYLINLYD